MSKHSILPASSCERWWNCPGSVEMIKKFPTEPNVYMAEGTVAHALIHTTLLNKWDEDRVREERFKKMVVDGFEIDVTTEMVDCVWDFVCYVRSRIKPGSVVKLEQRVDLSHVHPALFATPDVRILYPFEKLIVIDFKYGSGKRVNVYDNKQLRYYALEDVLKEDIDEVEFVIYQPRFGDGEPNVETVSVKSLIAFKDQLKAKAETALLPSAPLIAGPWCHSTFCPAVAHCPAVQQKAKELIAEDFKSVPSPERLTMKQIKQVLDHADFLVQWITKVKDYAKELALKGDSIPGYKIVQSYGHRAWRDDIAVTADFYPQYGDAIYETPKLKSPAKLEKIVGKGKIEDYCFKPENGFKLVSEEEKGEPIRMITAQEDFKK